jgi:type VI secretion system Hcp family effector
MIKIGYLTIETAGGETISGPSVYSMAPDTIEIVDMTHLVRHEYDEQHGTPTGDRKHQPLTVYKEVDMTTPRLCSMCCTAERLSTVKLQYYIQIGNAPEPVEFFNWTLTDAYIVRVRSIPSRELGPAYEEQYDLLEEVLFSYQNIQWEHHAHTHPIGVKDLPQVIAADSWASMSS